MALLLAKSRARESVLDVIEGVCFCNVKTIDFPQEFWFHSGASFQPAHLEKFSRNISRSSFIICVNLLHP